MKTHLTIGSRGSQLALRQANFVKTQLETSHADLEIRIEIIKTSGDIKTEPLAVIGGKGVFTKELEDALLDRRIDIAVHSLKDLPTIVPAELVIAAICEREDPSDALVLRLEDNGESPSLSNLRQRSVVGTSSQRRLAQLKFLRPDVQVKDLRGNVDTRLRKLDEGQYDALILASAGLRRLGLAERINASIPSSEMLPAVGQGALGIETRAGDEFTIAKVSHLNHEASRVACTAERALLRTLGGGCQLPIAGHAELQGSELSLEGLVAEPEGKQIVRNVLSGPIADPEALGVKLAERLLEQGAGDLLGER
ncbi:MAG: hydroxymethylbilane synthase [bacterium]